jgi:uncharacterized protein (TIGR02594 family)
MTNVSTSGAQAVPAYFLTALGEYGVKEVTGSGTNVRIAEYLRTCNVPPQGADETPWCSAFINWCMVHSGFRGTASAAARSWLTWGNKVHMPTMGTVTVLWRDDPKSGKGHVGFYVRREGQNVSQYPVNRILDLRGP